MGRDRYLTLEEAAQGAGKTVLWIKANLCRGELDGKLEGRRWLVSVESLRKIAPGFSPPKPETAIRRPLPRRPSRIPPPETETAARDRSAPRAKRACEAPKKSGTPAPSRNGAKAEPNGGRRGAIESRVRALDGKIAKLGGLLRKEEMLEHGPVGAGRGLEGYGKAAEKLRRVWEGAREERARLVSVLEKLDEAERAITGSLAPKAPSGETGGRPVGGIDGYYAGRSETEGEPRRLAGDAISEARLLISWSRARASARSMQDRGAGRAGRAAATEGWAQARREAERIQRELRDGPAHQEKGAEAERAVARNGSGPSKAKKKGPVRSPRASSSPPPSAPPTSGARPTGKDNRPGPPHDLASVGRNTTARQPSRVLRRRVEGQGHSVPLVDPSSGVVLVVEQPVGPRVLEALKACLEAVGLPEAYVTYASAGLLRKELLATHPHALVAVGDGGAREIDATGHPSARRAFSEAEPGVPFSWTRRTRGLLLPSLVPALDDEGAKRRFWRAFLRLKELAPPQ